jgi:glycosyltransferase involved in cell wall biosynthesis
MAGNFQEMMVISVIVPMYNAERSIISCLESVLHQNYNGKIEIIVVNDGSTDRSTELVNNFISLNSSDLIDIVLLNQNNGGVSKARNAGLSFCKGDLIALLDADDVWDRSKLKIQVELLQARQDIDFVGCARNNEVLSILGKRITTLHKASVLELLIKMYPQTSTAIFKRRLYVQYGGYNEHMRHGEDGDLWIRYCANCNFYYSPESLVLTGDGKRHFGESGLSADLRKMEQGAESNLIAAMKSDLINLPTFVFLYAFYKVKYLRRILITKLA